MKTEDSDSKTSSTFSDGEAYLLQSEEEESSSESESELITTSHLIIDIKEEIDTIDPDVFTSLATIINSERMKDNPYIICFVNILKPTQVQIKIINERIAPVNRSNDF